MYEIMCSIMKNVPCAFEKEYVCCSFGVDEYSVYVCWVQLTYSVKFLLIFCLVVLSIIESGVMMSPTIVVELPVSFFSSFSFCFYFGPLVKYIYFIIKSQRFV